MKTGWLNCTISKGMFATEVLVDIAQGLTKTDHSYFVPKDLVRGDIGSQGLVRVKLFDSEDKGRKLALVPAETPVAIVVDEAELKLV